MKKILVTGGLGFIGSETAICLIENGYEPIIVDDLYNAKLAVLDRIETITGTKPKFYQIDCKNELETEKAFKENQIDAVIHFAGYKAVGESVAKPIEYYENNLETLLVIAKLMRKYDVKNIIFSSSATVYGVPTRVPLYESDPVAEATNPYGETKVMIERILKDIHFADKSLNVGILRYFNPIGGHPSGLLGEDPNDIPNNLMPYISQVAVGKRDHLNVFGNDYPTHDGTGVRDYIHVVDLAEGHVKALKAIENRCGVAVYNLGTGRGYSVLDVVRAFEEASGVKIPYTIAPRRPGDIAECYSCPEKAERELGWKARYTLYDMCFSSWNWQRNNPEGY